MTNQVGNFLAIVGPSKPADSTAQTTRLAADFKALLHDASDQANRDVRLSQGGETASSSSGALELQSRNNVGHRFAPNRGSAPNDTLPQPPVGVGRAHPGRGVGSAEGSGADVPADQNIFVPPGSGYVLTSDVRASHMVRFAEVPDFAKYPLGPFRQAPPEFGGDWWQVNPFYGAEPWLKLEATPSVESLPEGFVEVFGPRPQSGDFKTNRGYRVARVLWEQELKYFRGIGTPEGTDPAKLEEANRSFEEWGLGRPVFFQSRYGWRVRFPQSDLPSFGGSPKTAVQAPHILIAHYQIQQIRNGITPSQLHPWLPTHVRSPESTVG